MFLHGGFALEIHTRQTSGWTSLMTSVWLLGGMIMLSTGIIGIYVSKVLSEAKKRPYTLVRAIYKKQEK